MNITTRLLLILALPCATSLADDKGSIRLPVTRDTWLSGVGPEADGSNGGAPRLKVKSYQELSIVDIDPSPLRGRVVRKAALHLKSASEAKLLRVTVGTVAADWVEGTANGYASEVGSSTFHHKRHPDVAWTVPGGDVTSVILGNGGSLWLMADASPPDADGWQTVPVDPVIVAARVAGISDGFVVFDDTGSEWTRDGEEFTPVHMPNRFAFSREQNRASAPYFTVELGPADRTPPAAPRDFQADAANLPAGEAFVTWTTPPDAGPGGTIGFLVKIDGKEIPRYLIPLAGKPGERVQMHVRDLGLKPGAKVPVSVRAVDGAGNVGPAAETSVAVSARTVKPLPGTTPKPFAGNAPLPALGTAKVAIVDELDKIHPVTAAMIPPHPASYLSANHLWDSAGKIVRLHAAKNESVGFQIVVQGPTGDVQPTLTFKDAKITAEFGRYQTVNTGKGPLPDPIVTLKTASDSVSGATSSSLHCELYVPHDAKTGTHDGTLTLTSDGATLSIHVALNVWDFTLPDELSFFPEMNCYGLPDGERDFYRLAHKHRTVLNRVPYSQRGEVADGCAPVWNGKTFDWTAWDKRFGPYFDGSAFRDLPRKGVPIELFYLPVNENWPLPINEHYNNGYWADESFTQEYRKTLVEITRQFAEHVNAKGWNDTLFLFFLNGKNDFKKNGWSRGSSPWLLDEPANFQDFWALRYFGQIFQEGIAQAPGKAKLLFRADVSRPQWQRDSLDGLLDYNVIGGALREYPRTVFDRKQRESQLVIEYASANAIDQSNVQAVGWSIDSWSLGTDGVLPWQTIGTADSWKRADELSLFYPPRPGKDAGPVPSIRLKAFRRGQQDVEYLTLLSQLTGEPRWSVGAAVRDTLHLKGTREGTAIAAVEDAGRVQFSSLTPETLWAFRTRLGQVLSDAHPAPKRRLVEFRTRVATPHTWRRAMWRHPDQDGLGFVSGKSWGLDCRNFFPTN